MLQRTPERKIRIPATNRLRGVGLAIRRPRFVGPVSQGSSTEVVEVKRAVAVLVVLMMLALPVMGAGTPVVTAADTITIVAMERGSDKPALYTCYSLQDLAGGNSSGGGQGTACDGNSNDGDGVANGTVIVTTPPTGECNLCRVTQSLPPQPAGTDYNGPKPVSGSIYLTEQPQEGTAPAKRSPSVTTSSPTSS